MRKLIPAIIVVVAWSYLPVVMLALLRPPDGVAKFLPVIPGWLVWFVAPRDELAQFRAAAAATPCVILVLAWIGSKGRLPMMAAGILAFLNSSACIAIYVVVSGVVAATGSG